MQFESSFVVSSVPMVQDFFGDVIKIFSSIPIEYYKYSSIILGCFAVYDGFVVNILQNISSLRSAALHPTLDMNAIQKYQDIKRNDQIIKKVIPNTSQSINDLKKKLSNKNAMNDLIQIFFFVYQINAILTDFIPILSTAAAPLALFILFQDHKTLAKSTYYSQFFDLSNTGAIIIASLIGLQAIFYPLAIQLLILLQYDAYFDFFTLLDIVFQPIMIQVFLQLLPISGARVYLKMAKTTSGIF
ncbi:UNKNOWN [Stylonychia lemnae]|uniref:Uncharacterized protein n=1 Tax=Stylonychia lemnae TaxID=5949 RepID=A0A078ACB0_STYLE|nr:UNKNOWN [Stylonychia lemnae]|eukprot:CDW79471.1 UNKNOWN [Stylonychia lemnae]